MGRNLGKIPSGALSRLMELYSVNDLVGLATAMNLPPSTVRNWHARGAVPATYLAAAAQQRGSTVDWLMEGIRPRSISLADSPLLVNKNGAPTHLSGATQATHHIEKIAPAIARLTSTTAAERQGAVLVDDNMVREQAGTYADRPFAVPLYQLAASAGNGSGAPPGDPPEVHVSFSPSYMRRHFGRAGDGFAMIYVKGDSMQPGLFDGDEIVIDTRQRRVDRDGIYVITLRGDLKVKRIQQRLDGSLVVKSDNPAYEPELVTAAQAEEFTVEGRLVWPRLR